MLKFFCLWSCYNLVWTCVFISCGHILRSWLAESNGNSYVLSFWGITKLFLKNGSTSLHSHQQHRRIACPHILAVACSHFCCCCCCYSHSNTCDVIAHGFDLYSPGDWWWSSSFHVFIGHFYTFCGGNIHSLSMEK